MTKTDWCQHKLALDIQRHDEKTAERLGLWFCIKCGKKFHSKPQIFFVEEIVT